MPSLSQFLTCPFTYFSAFTLLLLICIFFRHFPHPSYFLPFLLFSPTLFTWLLLFIVVSFQWCAHWFLDLLPMWLSTVIAREPLTNANSGLLVPRVYIQQCETTKQTTDLWNIQKYTNINLILIPTLRTAVFQAADNVSAGTSFLRPPLHTSRRPVSHC